MADIQQRIRSGLTNTVFFGSIVSLRKIAIEGNSHNQETVVQYLYD